LLFVNIAKTAMSFANYFQQVNSLFGRSLRSSSTGASLQTPN